MDSPQSGAKGNKRRHSMAFKRKLVALTKQPGASVASIALEHGVNANLVFKWRRQQLGIPTPAKPGHAAVLLPVTMEPLPPMSALNTPAPGLATTPRATPCGVIEIELGGARVRLRGSVDQDSVRCVLQTLREAS